MPGPSSSTSRKAWPLRRAGAHRDAAAARRVFERVVHQVGERLAQQERVAVDAARRARSRGRCRAPAPGAPSRRPRPRPRPCRSSVRAGRARARLGARQREQLVGEARGADRRAVHLLELRAASGSGIGCASASSVCACRPASGVRSWCAASARKRCWLRFAADDLAEQAVQRADQRPRLLGRAGGVDRPQVARRARLDLVRQARERLQAALHAEPDDHQRRQRDQQLGQQALRARCRARARVRLTVVSATSTVQVRARRRAPAPRPRAPSRPCTRVVGATPSPGGAGRSASPAIVAGRPGLVARGSRWCRSGRCAAPARPPPGSSKRYSVAP